ncbi:hypothetical protein ACOJUR_09655 [Alicyclobacillus tolerans]|uniref:hypothetical protein n=1 Tax=Alicyclobacillus tolerans TaxID=90970 RepID=UPI003B80FC34
MSSNPLVTVLNPWSSSAYSYSGFFVQQGSLWLPKTILHQRKLQQLPQFTQSKVFQKEDSAMKRLSKSFQ